jgi:hypothetical protein
MIVLEFLPGVLIAILTLPLLLIGMVIGVADMPRYLKLKWK